jgi:hypothetical protein
VCYDSKNYFIEYILAKFENVVRYVPSSKKSLVLSATIYFNIPEPSTALSTDIPPTILLNGGRTINLIFSSKESFLILLL